jgi:hypothetical protein
MGRLDGIGSVYECQIAHLSKLLKTQGFLAKNSLLLCMCTTQFDRIRVIYSNLFIHSVKHVKRHPQCEARETSSPARSAWGSLRRTVINLKTKKESIIEKLDKKFPIIERLQATPLGWIGKDRLFSTDAVDHSEFVDLSGNAVTEDDHRSWGVIKQVTYNQENEKYWAEAFSKMWDKYGMQIVSIIRSNKLTPKQQKVMELVLDGHKMVEIQLLLQFKHRSDVTRHFKRGAKKIFKLLQKTPEVIQLAEAA